MVAMTDMVASRFPGSDIASRSQRQSAGPPRRSLLSYGRLLEFLSKIHVQATRIRQGNDIGMSYRSAILYPSPEQERVARDTIADVDASGIWPGKASTEVAPAREFWEAEPEHQDYLKRYPDGYTCHFVRPGWRLPQRKAG